MSTIGSRHQQKREERGWSQSELARRMVAAGWPSYSQTVVSRTEAGSRTPRLGEAVAVAGTLGVTLDWLATGALEAQGLYDNGYRDGITDARKAIEGLIA